MSLLEWHGWILVRASSWSGQFTGTCTLGRWIYWLLLTRLVVKTYLVLDTRSSASASVAAQPLSPAVPERYSAPPFCAAALARSCEALAHA